MTFSYRDHRRTSEVDHSARPYDQFITAGYGGKPNWSELKRRRLFAWMDQSTAA